MSESAAAMKTAVVSDGASSQTSPRSDAVWAYGLLRLTFGINIMLHGVSRLLAPPGAFLAYLTHYFEKTPLMPPAMLPPFAIVLPWAEAIFGALLLFGFATRIGLIGGALTLAALAFGTNLAQDWNIAGLQLIYALIYYFLLLKREELNALSIDGLLHR
jgi:thiosulfate dehydrogenase [quinone] large subunit